jgi:hypothetical protein
VFEDCGAAMRKLGGSGRSPLGASSCERREGSLSIGRFEHTEKTVRRVARAAERSGRHTFSSVTLYLSRGMTADWAFMMCNNCFKTPSQSSSWID